MKYTEITASFFFGFILYKTRSFFSKPRDDCSKACQSIQYSHLFMF